jgi:hypothetical protein
MQSPQEKLGPNFEATKLKDSINVKRIKLIFHQDLNPAPHPSDPPLGLHIPRPGKWDIVLRRRRTPPLAILNDELSSDFEDSFEDSWSPPSEVKRRRFISGVVVPCKRIDKSLYVVFLSGRAKQTMVTSKRDGTFKGIKFEWQEWMGHNI